VAFGTTAGTVAAGNHVHAGYQPLLSGAIPCPAGSFVSNISPTTGVVTCQAESQGQLYTAGYGLNLAGAGDEFEVDTDYIQVRLSSTCGVGQFVASINPATGQVTCGTPAGASYTAGEGISISGDSQLSVNFGVTQRRVSISGDTNNGLCPAGQIIRGINPATGAITCVLDMTEGSTGGEIVSVSGVTPIVTDTVSGNVQVSIAMGTSGSTAAWGNHGHAEFADFADYDETISAITCAVGQVVKYTAAGWACANDTDQDTTYTGSLGVTLTGTNFTADTAYLQRRVGSGCAAGQAIRAIDATGAVTCEVFPTYTAGTGLSLTGTQFAVNTTSIQARVTGTCPAGQSIRVIAGDGGVTCQADTTYTAGTGLSLTGTTFAASFAGTGSANSAARSDHNHGSDYMAALTCAAGLVLKATASGWECGTDLSASYSAGTGLSLSGTTFSADATYLQRRVSGTCAAGQAIRTIAADGTVTCQEDTNTVYTAGSGLSLSGTAFSAVYAGAGSANSAARSDHDHAGAYLPAQTCTAGHVLKYNGTAWACAPDDDTDTTYTAGTGLSLSGTQFAVNTTAIQSRVGGTCAAGSSIRSIAADGTVLCQDDTNTTYTAGSGLSLSGTAFAAVYAGPGSANSAARSDHDHTGTYLPATTCTVGYVLKATASGWNCDQDNDTNTTYTAGTGLTLSGTAFSADAAYLQRRVSATCAAGQSIRAIAADGTVTCEVDDDTNTTYTAGTGLTLTGTAFSANTSVLQNRVSGTCAAGSSIQTIAADGTVTCHTDVDTNTTYTAGSGLTLAGTAFSVTWAGTGTANTASRSDHTHSAYTYTAGTGLTLAGSTFSGDMSYLQRRLNISGNYSNGTCPVGELIKAIDPATGAITCAVDQTEGSTGGTIVSVTGVSPVVATTSTTGHVQISVPMGTDPGELAWGDHTHAEFAEFADYDEPLEGIDMCTNGQVLKYNAGTAAWECGSDVDTNTTYSAGTALTLSGTTFNVNLGTTSATAAAGNHTHAAYTYTAGTGLTLAGTTFSADAAYLQRRVTGTCAAGSSIQAVAADGTVTCETDNDTTYTAGTGLGLTGTQFAVNTAAIQARVGTTCAAGSSIREITAAGGVTCQTDANTTYTAGTGLSLSGTAFSAVYAGTGSANSAARSDHDHTGAYLPAATCTNGYVMKYVSGSWTCAADDNTTYTASTGLTLSGTAFAVDTTAIQARVGATCAAGSSIREITAAGGVTCQTDANTTYTAGTGLSLSGTAFSAVYAGTGSANSAARSDHDHTGTYLPAQTCTAGYVLKYISGAWSCAADDNTTYAAGTGLSLTGTTFAANPTYLQRRLTGSCVAGYAIRSIAEDGTPTCEYDDDTTYTAGTGLSLSGTQFAVNTTAIQARVTGTCATGSSIRTIDANGAVSCQADSNTTYSAGTALSLSGTTFNVSLGTTSTTAAAGNHLHTGVYAADSHNHDATYIKRTGDTVDHTGTYTFNYSGALGDPFHFNNYSTSTSTTHGMYVNNANPLGAAYGLLARVYDSSGTGGPTTSGTVYGSYILGYNTNTNRSGTVYGLYAQATNNADTTTYGLYATTMGTGTGTRYAGYFVGDVMITGNTTISGLLTVNGASGGNVPHNCSYIRVSSTTEKIIYAECPSTRYIVSGGCYSGSSSLNLYNSYPTSSGGVFPLSGSSITVGGRWNCAWNGAATATLYVWALCCAY
jgi:hypothetical protein